MTEPMPDAMQSKDQICMTGAVVISNQNNKVQYLYLRNDGIHVTSIHVVMLCRLHLCLSASPQQLKTDGTAGKCGVTPFWAEETSRTSLQHYTTKEIVLTRRVDAIWSGMCFYCGKTGHWLATAALICPMLYNCGICSSSN